MSYRLEYQWLAWQVSGNSLGLAQDRYVVAIEGGDNNLRDAVTGKRARSWDVCMLGTRAAVLKSAVDFAGACEGGSLKPAGRDCTPEAYIRRIKRLLEQSVVSCTGRWYPAVRLPEQDEAVADLLGLGLPPPHRFERYGQAQVQFVFAQDRLGEFFDFADRHPRLPAWRLAEVIGLPAS